MDNRKRVKKLKEKDYQKYFGVNKTTFEKMLEILEEADRYKRRKGGRPSVPRKSIFKILLILHECF